MYLIKNRRHKMDILQPLPIEKWYLLRDSLKRDCPIYANACGHSTEHFDINSLSLLKYYYLINNAIKWKKKDPDFKIQLYCPNGNVDSGTFVGISTQPWYVVYIFAFNESRDLLRKILTETRMIHWNEYVQFAAVHPHFDNVLVDFIENEADDKNFTSAGINEGYLYFKPKEECFQLELSIPEERELRNLNESHIANVHSVWPHRSKEEPEKSTQFLASMVRLNQGVGLFLKKEGSLVSWVLHSDWGGLGMLQTSDGHKRKGYAKIVVKAMMKKLVEEENLDSFVYALTVNKLFKSLGFVRITSATWHFTEPKDKLSLST